MPAARREIRWDEFGALCRDLARAVAPTEPDIVVGIVRGGAIVGCTLSFMLGREFYPIRLKKTGRSTRVVIPPSPELKGMHVALVDDLSESGDTFRIAQHELNYVGVKKITTVALVRRSPGYQPDFFALEVNGKVRFPWAAEQMIDGELKKRV